MKTIKGLEKRIQHFNEEDKVSPNELPTVRRMILNLLGAGKAKDGDEALAMWDLGLRIRRAEDSDITIEDADFKLINEKVKENILGWSAHYHAQMLLIMRETQRAAEAEKASAEPKKEEAVTV
jgi:hypothetical protein